MHNIIFIYRSYLIYHRVVCQHSISSCSTTPSPPPPMPKSLISSRTIQCFVSQTPQSQLEIWLSIYSLIFNFHMDNNQEITMNIQDIVYLDQIIPQGMRSRQNSMTNHMIFPLNYWPPMENLIFTQKGDDYHIRMILPQTRLSFYHPNNQGWQYQEQTSQKSH